MKSRILSALVCTAFVSTLTSPVQAVSSDYNPDSSQLAAFVPPTNLVCGQAYVQAANVAHANLSSPAFKDAQETFEDQNRRGLIYGLAIGTGLGILAANLEKKPGSSKVGAGIVVGGFGFAGGLMAGQYLFRSKNTKTREQAAEKYMENVRYTYRSYVNAFELIAGSYVVVNKTQHMPGLVAESVSLLVQLKKYRGYTLPVDQLAQLILAGDTTGAFCPGGTPLDNERVNSWIALNHP
jgi:hypothetical protein